MYTATMLYKFREDSFDQACEIWKNEIFTHARSQPGFVRMQLLTASPKALAIGTWQSNAHARKFMETGVFKKLMGRLQDLAAEQPKQDIWELRLFAQSEA